jgi:hypothetical protein
MKDTKQEAKRIYEESKQDTKNSEEAEIIEILDEEEDIANPTKASKSPKKGRKTTSTRRDSEKTVGK